MAGYTSIYAGRTQEASVTAVSKTILARARRKSNSEQTTPQEAKEGSGANPPISLRRATISMMQSAKHGFCRDVTRVFGLRGARNRAVV
jgi:hypothetical protein